MKKKTETQDGLWIWFPRNDGINGYYEFVNDDLKCGLNSWNKRHLIMIDKLRAAQPKPLPSMYTNAYYINRQKEVYQKGMTQGKTEMLKCFDFSFSDDSHEGQIIRAWIAAKRAELEKEAKR